MQCNVFLHEKNDEIRRLTEHANYLSLFIWSVKSDFDHRLIKENIKMSSFKSSENIQKKKDGPDRSVSDNQSSSVALNELAIKARKTYCNF